METKPPTLIPPDLDAFRLYLVQARGKKTSTAGLYRNVVRALLAAHPQGAGHADMVAWVLTQKPSYTESALRFFQAWCMLTGYPVIWDIEGHVPRTPIVCGEAHHALWSLLDDYGISQPLTMTWADFWPVWSEICQRAAVHGGAALGANLAEVARKVQQAGQGGAFVFAATTGSASAGDLVFTLDQILAAGPKDGEV